jgi:adenylate cyclase
MSANIYSIENLLVGKIYRSRTLTGEIVSAEKHPACLHYENAEAYLVEVRDSLKGGYTFRTLAVKVND